MCDFCVLFELDHIAKYNIYAVYTIPLSFSTSPALWQVSYKGNLGGSIKLRINNKTLSYAVQNVIMRLHLLRVYIINTLQ